MHCYWLSVRMPEPYEPLRANVNRALAFVGLHVESDGTLKTSDAELGCAMEGSLD
jgi:hypothetical protein